jgi:CO/xanthine dehydrogenase Mo-binding subunit
MSSPSLEAHPLVCHWITLDEPGVVIVHSGKVEIGQRISTSLLGIAAAELGVGPERVRLAPVVTGESPDEGMTSGSNSIEHSGEAVRLAAATARRHLTTLAARFLGVSASSLELADGLLRERGSNRSVSYWELLPGGRLEIPVDADADGNAAALVPDAMQALRRQRAGALATGTEIFVHDGRLPGMLHARVIRPPHDRARLSELDSNRVPAGIHLVREGGFVAVAGDDEYAVVRAAQLLARHARWDADDSVDDGPLFQRLTENERVSLPVVDGVPVDAPVPPPVQTPSDVVAMLAARYERPYQMHGAIGPSAAMAVMRDGILHLWSHSQGVYPLRASIAQALGLAEDRVRIEHGVGAGCYGHNGADDAALDAALVARAIPERAVLLKWSREDEHAFEPFAPAMVVSMQGSVDDRGRVRTWSHEAFSDTHLRRPRPGTGSEGPARLLATRWLPDPPARAHTGIHRNADPYYSFPDVRVVKHLVRGLPLRTSAMRTLGGFMNVFAIECFLDELAHETGIDPLALRLTHQDDPRARELLERVAREIDWGDRPADAHSGKGIAFARYKNRQAYTAVAVEVSVDASASVRLQRVAIAADAGRVVDADGLAAQLEGGFLQAASWTLYEAVRYDASGVTSRDWDSYPILRFDNVPEIAVDIVDRPQEPPLGAGEAVSGPAGAAIANAVFAATGLRARRLPLSPESLRDLAL